MSWQEDKVKISQRYFEAINLSNIQLYGLIKENQWELRPIYPFISFIIDRLCAVTDLVIRDQVWDAEIINRTALETFVKFLYIVSAEKAEFEQRQHEFWTDLEEINRLKQSEQCKKNFKQFGDNEASRLAYSPIVLSQEEEARLKTKWTKANRQRIEQKWSFSEILNSLMKNSHNQPVEMFVGLAHSYRMACHLGHGDETGILIIAEREQRPQELKDVANFAHYLRLLSNSFSYCSWTAIESSLFLKKHPKVFIEIRKSLVDIHELAEKYILRLYDDPDYDKFRDT